MKVVVQRVSRGSVSVDGSIVGEVGHGLVLLVGIADGDDDAALRWMADKVAGLRIFQDDEGRMNHSVEEVGGGILAISQFTLLGDARKGRRPSFVGAASPELAEPAFEKFVGYLRSGGLNVGTGVFGASMEVSLVNDGPVTILLERDGAKKRG